MATIAVSRDELLYVATQYMAGVCDGAVKRDDQGFNAWDSVFGREMAERPWEAWTPKQKVAVHRMLRKYRAQLERYGIRYEDILTPELPEAPTASLQITAREPAQERQVKSQGSLRIEADSLIFHPNVYPSSQVRSLATFHWDATSRNWVTQPVSRDLITGICRLFTNVELHQSVQQWLADSGKAERASADVKQGLFDYQQEAVDFLLKNSRAGQGALLALAPGLGKTVVAIRSAVAVNKQHILVVAPLSLLRNWQKEIARWAGPEQAVVVHHGEEVNGNGCRWAITNYDTLRRKGVGDSQYDCIIVDESVLVKNRKAQRTRRVWELINNQKRACCWLLSGAPITRYYDDMWAQLRSFAPRRFRSYWRFVERYCLTEQNQFGTSVVANRNGAADMLKTDLADIYFSRRQEDVLDLPQFLFEDVEVAMSRQQTGPYAEMETTFIAHLSEIPGDMVLAPNVLSQLTRLIQLASSPALVGGQPCSAKMDYVLEAVVGDLVPKPLIVWTNFIDTARILTNKLAAANVRVAMLVGSTPADERQQVVERFQAGELDVIVAHPGVGKFGLTLTRGRTAIYMERGYSGDDYYQSLHRIRRIGTKESPYVVHLLACRHDGTPTIDHVINRVLRRRFENVQELTAESRLTAGELLEELTR